MEHGQQGHLPNMLYDEGMKVPFLFLWNQKTFKNYFGSEDEVRNDLISLIDLAPTIAGLAGVKYYGFIGRNIINDKEGESVLMVGMEENEVIYALRTEKWKLIKRKDDWELYDIQLDPGEQNNVFYKEIKEATFLRRKLEVKLKEEEKARIARIIKRKFRG